MEKKAIMQDGDVSQTDEEMIFNPYNEKNIEITQDEINSILKNYGVPDIVHNVNLYKRAFIHKSYCKRPHLENVKNNVIIAEKPTNCMKLKTKSNERLEFLGDGVLECITKYYLYRRFPKENEGFMTEKKIALVKNEHIGKLAYEMGLNKWYIMSANAEEKKTRTNLKKLGCLFEAFLGALFLDFNKITIEDEGDWFKNVFVTGPGFQIAQKFVESIFERHVDWMNLIRNDDNYKNILQVILQKSFQVTPVYKEINPWDEELGYHMGVYLCLNVKSHEFDSFDKNIKNIDLFTDSSRSNALPEIIKCWESMQLEEVTLNKMIVFLGENKHKIKKKAEQAACKNIIDKLIT